MTTRAQILVRGIVQGVGFRPFVFLQARRRALRGRVHNDSRGVLIDVEGEAAAIEQLVDALQSQPPPLSRIESITRRALCRRRTSTIFKLPAASAAASGPC